MQDRGLGFQAISTLNNRLIYVSISAFDASGPYANYLGYDLQMWHGSGAVHRFLGEPDREPLRGAWNMASHWAGITAACAIMIALRARDVTGQGQFVDVPGAEA